MILLTCGLTIMINLSGIPWNKTDNMSKKRAMYVCQANYNACLFKFIKKEKLVYRAVCG